VDRTAGAPGSRIGGGPRTAAAELVAHPESIDEDRLRLGVALVLSLAAVYFFRDAALPPLLAAIAGAAAVLVALNLGFHRLGARALGRMWPGVARALGAGLLVGCLAPPRAPVLLVFALAALAILIEGRLRRLGAPLAAGGVLVAWLFIWLWRLRAAADYLRPFDLRPLDEPVTLWLRFARDVDPVRLYTGNVPGPIGATSFGLIAVCVLLLAYARRASWPYIGGFFAPIAAMCLVRSQPLTIYLINGQALLFAGLLGAEARRLPLSTAWRAGCGVVAGAGAAILMARGVGADAYGLGVAAVAVGTSLFQMFGLAGSPPVATGRAPARRLEGLRPRPGLGQLTALVVLAPVGMVLLWRDPQLTRREKASLVLVGTGLYVLAAVSSLIWIWYFRIPS
jgi:hypothetical protein